jgi:hypothetical protein
VPVFVIVTEPVAVSPIFIAAELKMAPEPERLIVSEPEANALDEIVVGVAVKLAKVPPTAATAAIEITARLRRIFVSGRFLSMYVSVLSLRCALHRNPGMETRAHTG